MSVWRDSHWTLGGFHWKHEITAAYLHLCLPAHPDPFLCVGWGGVCDPEELPSWQEQGNIVVFQNNKKKKASCCSSEMQFNFLFCSISIPMYEKQRLGPFLISHNSQTCTSPFISHWHSRNNSAPSANVLVWRRGPSIFTNKAAECLWKQLRRRWDRKACSVSDVIAHARRYYLG